MKRIWGKKSNLDDNEEKGSEVYIPEKFHKLGHIEFIGKGSVSSVYKINGEKSYALKVVECGNNEKVYFDVLKEIDIMRKLKSCKGVVHILDSDIIDENGCKIVYILEEYLKTFSDYLKVKTLSVLQIVNTIRELCDALIECRNAGVAHLDIQPKNLFINEEGKIVVGDFGCSLYVEELKNNQIMRGTLAFMAPEVYREKRCSEQSEIYSIGINLYCLFNNNQLPFMDKDNEEVAVYKRLAGTSFTIMSYKGAFIQELYQIVKKACEYDYQKRFKTFEDMRSALTVLYNRIIDVEITVRNSDIRIKDANRSVLPVLYVVQNSSDMRGDAIAQVNKIGRETISILKKISNFQMSDIRVALMCCGNDVTWIQKDLISVCDFEWKMLEANGFLSMNMALQELDRRLTRDDKCDGLFSSLVTSCYKPVIIYISNGDVIDEEESCLTEIGKNIWYLRALKIGFLVGPDANIKGGQNQLDYLNQYFLMII